MEIKKPISAETAMTILKKDLVGFLDILRKNLIPAYRENSVLFDAEERPEKKRHGVFYDAEEGPERPLSRPPAYVLVDVAEHLENKRYAVLKHRVWKSPKAQWNYKNNVPGWSGPDDCDFGGRGGRALFMVQVENGEFGPQHCGLPPAYAPELIKKALNDLTFEEGNVIAYERNNMPPVLAERAIEPDISGKNVNRGLSEKERALWRFAKERWKKKPSITIPDMVKLFCTNHREIVCCENSNVKRRGFTQQTLEKDLRRLLKSAK
ncbi:MAG: hypothetical protein ABSC19_12545 [Syntrophorhabdales bacterium]|jgi:hypothetical protein